MRKLQHGDKVSGFGMLAALAFCMVSSTALAETESSIMRGGEL